MFEFVLGLTIGLLVGALIEREIEKPIHEQREATLKKYRDFITLLNNKRIEMKKEKEIDKQ